MLEPKSPCAWGFALRGAQIRIEEGFRMTENRMTPFEVWEGYVGDQTVAEFLRIGIRNGERSISEMVTTYAHDLPNIFGSDFDPRQDLDEIATLLERYIRQSLPYIRVIPTARQPQIAGRYLDPAGLPWADVVDLDWQGYYPLLNSDDMVMEIIDASVGLTEEQEREWGVHFDEREQVYRPAL